MAFQYSVVVPAGQGAGRDESHKDAASGGAQAEASASGNGNGTEGGTGTGVAPRGCASVLDGYLQHGSFALHSCHASARPAAVYNELAFQSSMACAMAS